MSPTALQRLAAREADTALPGYTHMQQAMPSSVALWAGGFAAEIRDDAQGLRQRAAPCGQESAGLGRRLRHPGTAAAIASRRAARSDFASHARAGHRRAALARQGRSQLLFEIALLMQDLGRLAADVLLFYTQEFGFIELPDAFTTGSSIMPQKRNPDLFELIRARSASRPGLPDRSAGDLRQAALGLSARPAVVESAAVSRHRPGAADTGYRARGIDATAVPAAERIRLDPAIHAAEEANRLAWRRVSRSARPIGASGSEAQRGA